MSSQPGSNDSFPWTVTLADGSKWIAPGSLTFHVEDGGALVARDIDGAKAVKHDQPHRLGQVGLQPSPVVDAAARHHEAHAQRPAVSRIRFWIVLRRACRSR